MNKVMDWVKNNLWGLATLVVVFVASMFAIQHFKKPGQLTVIEANVMDMNAMKPPRGALPVGIVQAKNNKIEGTITYTGTVQAYEDEDVYPRIAGRIEKMPVYPGDRVSKGQLLVQLDTDKSEYTSRKDAAKYLGDAKMHEAGMARKDFEQAKFTMKAAEEEEIAAKKAVDDAQAQYDYWVPEIKRQEVLLKDDVVSKQEYDDELAKSKSAKAKLEMAKAELRKASNAKLAAKAAFEKAVHHVGHESSASLVARASEKTADTIDKYRNIRASGNGVVIKRLISPGVLVEPGMLILKLAHIDKVRVQAEVSNTDIDTVRLGDKVLISRGKTSKETIEGKITSIFPAADKASRTSIVEALIDNSLDSKKSTEAQVKSARQYRFLPGQYVVMNIVTGSKAGLTVPTEAIFHREGKPHLWLAASNGSTSKDGGGSYLSKLVEVETGVSNPDNTEITSGITEGDRVIYTGYGELQPKVPVVGVKWTDDGIEKLPFASEVAGNRLSAGNKWSLDKDAGKLKVSISMKPNPPKSKDNSVIVKLKDQSDKLVTGATITGTSSMPSMDMKGPDLSASSVSDGVFQIKSNFHKGLWNIDLKISYGEGNQENVQVDLEVP